MTVVLDCSATLAWIHGDERTEAVMALFRRVAAEGAVVPSLWHLEIANGLLVALRKGRISKAFQTEALSDLGELPIAVDEETEQHAWKATLELAAIYRLTLYDAAYLELAQRRRLPLATLDRALRDAAIAAGVEILPA